MNGPEHYAFAELDLDNALDAERGSDWERLNLAAAQVHATLALAAATALGHREGGMHGYDYEAWDRVAGVQDADEHDDGMTNADVMGYAEMAEHDRDDEFALDAADEARNAAAEAEANDHHDGADYEDPADENGEDDYPQPGDHEYDPITDGPEPLQERAL